MFYCEFFELAASIKNDQLRTQMSEANDPLASFLTQRISVGDQMVLQHYQDVGQLADLDDSLHATDASSSDQQTWRQGYRPQVHDLGDGTVREQAPSVPQHQSFSPADSDDFYTRWAEPMEMRNWLARHAFTHGSVAPIRMNTAP